MAHAMTYELSDGIGGIGGFVARIRKSIADYRLYHQTLDELQALNDRELGDLGISRHSIREIAYDSVYGA
jgi:uncharacterized protein YjiS (DUF1127 family)